MHCFLGFSGYSSKDPFDPSMKARFRKRISDEELRTINVLIVQRGKEMLVDAIAAGMDGSVEPGDPDGDGVEQLSLDSMVRPADWPEGKNWEIISIDASCVPADISCPTDWRLLNEARHSNEKIIDDLCLQSPGFSCHRPTTTAKKLVPAFSRSTSRIANAHQAEGCSEEAAQLSATLF